MLIRVHSDSHVQATEKLTSEIESNLQHAFARYADRLTRIEVFLSDTNAHKGGVDKKCVLETRPAGRQPIAVSHEGERLNEAIDGAIDRMLRALENSLGKQADHKGRPSMSGDQQHGET
jgi:ribosome-associated translation inhibitor RaiA